MLKRTVLAAALVACASLSAATDARVKMTGDQQLAKLLEGRTAGTPRSCINAFNNRDSRVIDGTAVVYGRGRTIWVNRTRNPDDLDQWDAMLVRQHGSQLCRQDIVTTFDPSSGMYTGNIFLTDFVPYTRAE